MNKKYNLDFKLKLINEYKNDSASYRSLGKKYGINHYYIIQWCHQLDTYGIDGLISGLTKTKYSKEEKLNIIQFRTKYNLSYQEAAKRFGIINATIIAQWQKKYNEHGILGLESKLRGHGSKPMNKKNEPNNKPLNETERQELERLRAENRQLEIGIALEKKLQSLARENQTKK